MWKVIFATVFGLVLTAPTENNDFNTVNEFALKLLDNTYAYQDNFGRNNFAISPISVWNLFSLLAEGSAGQTFQELLSTLKLPNDLSLTQSLHRATSNVLRKETEDVTLLGQSAMFSDCSLKVHEEFCKSAIGYYTDIYSVETDNVTKVAEDINYYVCVATDGYVKNAVNEDALANLKLLLVDALYFKANWTHPFDSTQTKTEEFYNTQGKTIGSVSMMYHKAPHNVGDVNTLEAQVLEMTYGKNEEFSMFILVPFDGVPLKKLLENLASQPLDWTNDFKSDDSFPEIDTYVPRFKISSKLDLIKPLQYSGIQTIFDPEKAELPGVSDTPLFVSKTIQNVEIEVNEEGTVAAAATVVGLEDRILGQRFEANKEFVFLILERKSNVILFAGVYQNPSVI